MIKCMLISVVLLTILFVTASCSSSTVLNAPELGDANREGLYNPGANLIAFSRPLGDYSNPNHELFLIRPDGSQEKRITWNLADDDYPAFAPKGLALAFCSNRDSQYGGWNHDVYTLNSLGVVKQLTHTAWEFDSTATDWTQGVITCAQLNTLTGVPFDLMRIQAMHPTGAWQKAIITPFPANYQPCISPDGTMLVFCARPGDPPESWYGNVELYVWFKGSDSPVQLTAFGKGNDPNTPIESLHPAFNFDGTKLVFQTNYWDGQWDLAWLPMDVISDKPWDAPPYRITDNPADDMEPCYDPQQRWFAFVSNRDGNFELYKTWDYSNPFDQPTPVPDTVRLTNTPQDEANPDWAILK